MEEEMAWLRRTVRPFLGDTAAGFDDLSCFKDLIGDARVVGLGESSHTAREQVLCKHLLMRLLVCELAAERGLRVGFLVESLE